MNAIETVAPPTLPNFVTVEDIAPRLPASHLDKFKDVDWENVVFTTFSICDSTMSEYEISEDEIYLRQGVEIEKLNYTGEIEFHTLLPLEDMDYELTFKALFYKGELKEFGAEDIKEHDQSFRKEAQERFMEVVRKQEERKKSWWYKIYKSYVSVIDFAFTCVRWVFASIIKLLWFIQNKIT